MALIGVTRHNAMCILNDLICLIVKIVYNHHKNNDYKILSSVCMHYFYAMRYKRLVKPIFGDG